MTDKKAEARRGASFDLKYNPGAGMRQEYKINCLQGWVQGYKEASHRWVQVGEVLKNPKYLTKFGIGLYDKFREADKAEMSRCKRKICWLLLGIEPQQKASRCRVNKDEIKDRVDCRQLAAQYIEVRSRGKYVVGLCPFHEDRRPSFVAYQNGFKCFGCQYSADCFKFVQDIEHVDFVAALRKVRTL